MTDLRAVPAAVAVWCACGVAVGGTPWGVALAAALSLLASGAALVVPRPAGAARALALVLVCTAAGLAATAGHLHLRQVGPLDELASAGASVTVVGVVRSAPDLVDDRFGQPRVRVVVVVREVAGRGAARAAGPATAPVVVLGEPAWGDVAYGSTVRARGHLVPLPRGDAALAMLVASAPETLAPAGPVDRAVTRLRDALRTVTEDLEPDARGLVPGAAVGDTSRVPPDLEEAMRATGLTHVTAVSGGHVAVLATCVLGGTALLGGGRWVRAVALGATLVGFVALVRPEPSVVRSAAMGAVSVLALAAGRPARALPALACGVVVLCLLDPWLARSYGFALSVLATAAIVVAARPLARLLAGRLPERAALVVAVPVAAQAVCAPVLVLLDPSVSLVAVPANLLAAPAVLPATLGGVVATVLAPWSPAAAEVVVRPAALACRWIASVARTLADLPGATAPWPEGAGGAAALAALTAAGVVALVVTRRRARPAVRRLLAGAACALLVVHVALPGVVVRARGWPPAGWDVVACDVGQGDALVVRSGPGAAVVVDVGPDGGGADRCLTELGVRRIDLLVLTHHHADHVGGLAEVLRGRVVDRVLVSPVTPDGARTAEVLAAVRAASPDVRVGAAGLAGRAGDVSWEVLWPRSAEPRRAPADVDGTALNDASVVLGLRTPRTSVVALGDLEPDAQAALLRDLTARGAWAHVDVVKVAHHGSARQDPRLAAWLAPVVAVVSAGADNDYGHPAPATVDLHEDLGALVLSTHACGPVAVRGGSVTTEDAGRDGAGRAAVDDGGPGTPRVWARCLGGRPRGRRRVAGCAA